MTQKKKKKSDKSYFIISGVLLLWRDFLTCHSSLRQSTKNYFRFLSFTSTLPFLLHNSTHHTKAIKSRGKWNEPATVHQA